ncbi:MAG: fused MFS/spermidine synthase [Chloroflexota bacterium]|nr:fused MFS/spermidine synthase [Chloroflexota bacterium]
MTGGLWVSYLIVFMASACTLVLELVAGRILAPFIGVSLYTWTSIIGVCLAGISIGNYLGGVAADRYGSRRTLGLILLAGGLSSLFILPLAATELTQIFPRGGPAAIPPATWLMTRIVLLTSLLFLPPTLILGMVSPIVIKLAITDLRHTGSVAGKIYAFSTAGSILGTFLTGFYLVSAFGTRMVVLGVAIILIGMAFVFGDFFGRQASKSERRVATGAVAAGLVALALAVYLINPGHAFANDRPDALDSGCYKETNYFCIKVTDHVVSPDRTLKTLVLDHLIHSYNSIEDPTYLQYGYIKVYAELVEYVAQTYPQYSAFFVGGGGYTLPRQMEALRPDAHIVVSEIDPGVTQTNFEQMGLDPNTNIITYNADARQVVEEYQGREKFDLVFGDAFNDLQIPYHLTTREFAQKIRNMLKDDGIYIALVIDKLNGGLFLPSYVRTIQTVFPHVYLMADGTPWRSPYPNTYLVAASATPIDLDRLKTVRGQGEDGATITGVMPQEMMAEWLRTSPSVILTDDYAPADNLVAPLFVERGF